MAAALAPPLVVALDLALLRTGLVRRPRFWLAMLVVLAFQLPVDGWLTGGRPPVVGYRPSAVSGLYGPWHIPVEDFGFGFALAALTMMLWERGARRGTEDGHG